MYPKENALASPTRHVAVEPRAMETLEFLAHRSGSVVSSEQLLAECWNDVSVGDNPVHKAIAQLRKALGDDPRSPRYIETIRKRGYRLIASVSLPSGYRGPVAPAHAGWSGGSPFRGLDAFDSTDSAIFFGRDGAIRTMLDALAAQLRNGSAFVLLVGASGSGKTSLLHAGVLPRLMATGPDGYTILGHARICGRGPGAMPLSQALASALARAAPRTIDMDLGHWQALCRHRPERAVEQLCAHLRTATDAGTARPLLVVFIDQLEDFFHAEGDRRDQRHDAQLLALLVRSDCVAVIAACRSDAYTGLSDTPGLLALKYPQGHVDLDAPNSAQIAEIIRRPMQLAALTFEEGPGGRLDDLLRDAAVDHPQGLPLLQHTLQQLYERRENGRLGFAAYQAIGGFDGALAQHAEQSVRSLPLEAQNALPQLLSHLVRCSPHGDRIDCVAVPMRLFEHPAQQMLIESLVRNRLLVKTADAAEPVLVIAHRALLSAWPRPAQWITHNRQDLRLRGRLADTAGRWRREGRRRDLLLPHGFLLEEARDLAQRRPDLLDEDTHCLIQASARQQRKRKRQRRSMAGAAALLTLVALASASSAHLADAQAQRDRARAEGMVDYMLGDLSERLEPLGRLDLLDALAERMLQEIGPAQNLNRARVLRQLGKVRIARGDAAAALSPVTESAAIAQRLARESPHSVELLINLGQSAYWTGYLHFLRGDTAAAQIDWERYRQAADAAATLAPHDARALTEVSYALNSLGTLRQKQERLTEALAFFRQSVAFKLKALRLAPNDLRLRADLTDSQSWIAATQEKLGRPQLARDVYRQAIEQIAEARRRAPQDAEWMHRESILLTRYAQLLRDTGQIAAARSAFAAADRLLAPLIAQRPDHAAWMRDRVASLNASAELELGASQIQAADGLLHDAIGVLASLPQQGAAASERKRLLLRTHANLAALAQRIGDGEEAARQLRAAQANAEPLATIARQGRLGERIQYAELLMLQAQLSGDAAQAQRHRRSAAELLHPYAKTHHERRLQNAWQRVLHWQGMPTLQTADAAPSIKDPAAPHRTSAPAPDPPAAASIASLASPAPAGVAHCASVSTPGATAASIDCRSSGRRDAPVGTAR